MTTVSYRAGRRLAYEGGIDWANDDIRFLLVRTGSTIITDLSVGFLSDFTDLREFDGAGYPVGFAARPTLGGRQVTEDAAQDEVVLEAQDEVIANLGPSPSAEDVAAVLVYKHGTSDADSVPLFADDTNYPQTPDGTDFTVQVHVDGLARVENIEGS